MANFNLDENIPILTATQQHSNTATQQHSSRNHSMIDDRTLIPQCYFDIASPAR